MVREHWLPTITPYSLIIIIVAVELVVNEKHNIMLTPSGSPGDVTIPSETHLHILSYKIVSLIYNQQQVGIDYYNDNNVTVLYLFHSYIIILHETFLFVYQWITVSSNTSNWSFRHSDSSSDLRRMKNLISGSILFNWFGNIRTVIIIVSVGKSKNGRM